MTCKRNTNGKMTETTASYAMNQQKTNTSLMLFRVNCICTLRNIYKAVNQCEKEFAGKFGLTLNEAMLLCSLEEKSLCASDLAEATDMQCSQTSKILKSLEDKDLIKRTLGKTDKRNMFFLLSEKGETMLASINSFQQEIPDILKPML